MKEPYIGVSAEVLIHSTEEGRSLYEWFCKKLAEEDEPICLEEKNEN